MRRSGTSHNRPSTGTRRRCREHLAAHAGAASEGARTLARDRCEHIGNLRESILGPLLPCCTAALAAIMPAFSFMARLRTAPIWSGENELEHAMSPQKNRRKVTRFTRRPWGSSYV